MKLGVWREQQGWTQERLGDAIGVTKVAVGRYEAGRVPRPKVMQKIIDVTAGAVTANDWHELPKIEAAA